MADVKELNTTNNIQSIKSSLQEKLLLFAKEATIFTVSVIPTGYAKM